MNFVGPKPALYNQDDLIELRNKVGVSVLTPGVAGYAQINGRDEISIPEKVKLDKFYLVHRSTMLNIKIILKTFTSVIASKNIKH